MTETVARTVVRLLADAGVRTAYTVPGESFLPLLDELQAEPRIRLVSTRHESGAAFMAEAEGKLTGRPALALASRGPGAANLAIGLHTADQDQTGLIAILGQVESNVRGREAFQEVDLADFCAPISRWSREAVDAADVPALTVEAYARAVGSRPGPAILSVPTDFWSQPYDGEPPPIASIPPFSTHPPSPAGTVDQAARELARLIARARHPVAIAGPGDRIGRTALCQASERCGFGVYVAFRRQDSVDEDHPHFLGHLGLGVPDRIRRGLDDADLVVLLGTRLDAITSQDFRYPLPGQHLVIVGRGLPSPRHDGPTTVLDVDPQRVLDRLAGKDVVAGNAPTTRSWDRYHQAAVAYAVPPTNHGANGIHPADVVTALRRLAPDDVILTNDAGNFAAFLHRYWRFRTSHRLLGPCNGAMGYAVPAAVAAKLARPHQSVVALVGDGGILMTGQEIETAVRYDAPIVVVAFQNGMYGTIAMHQALRQGRLAAVDIGRLDLARWAEGLGAKGIVLDDPADIEDALRTALRSTRPCVVDVRTDPDVIAPERRLSQLL
ncbi:thiamine pyrophosphate-binding protein [Actinopolymorpha alba]|uniref:thiamine pyrophosphate-binding protein n=1 Tax=Actinopolymorpha alba TaxID=533267 RepID=UPI00035DCBF2|nr:thiamine pyrophosphate-dependent enzyme [Actinopolymorpha alba]